MTFGIRAMPNGQRFRIVRFFRKKTSSSQKYVEFLPKILPKFSAARYNSLYRPGRPFTRGEPWAALNPVLFFSFRHTVTAVTGYFFVLPFRILMSR